MRTFITYFITFVIIGQTLAQEIKFYDFDINIDILEKKLHVKCIIDIDFEDNDSISFLLWKNSTIHSISYRENPLSYVFDTVPSAPIMFIPNGRSLILKKIDGTDREQKIKFDYECDMSGLRGWGKSFSEEWVELNLYSGWYPICWNSRSFKSTIKLTISDAYVVTGSGIVTRKDNYWEMNQPWVSIDNVIIASKKLKSKIIEKNNYFIEVVYSELSEDDADSVLQECEFISMLYQNLFGKNDSTYIKFVIIPYMRGGYARKNFSTLRTKEFNKDTRAGIAHELSHLWWSNANTSTWDDWLNEAFAEYSMLMYIRERLGVVEFEARIEKYKRNAQNTPPIWGIDRSIPEAYTVLYEKGALVLYELENKLGKEQFKDFLRRVLELNIRTTTEMLNFIEKEISFESRRWLEEQLKTA